MAHRHKDHTHRSDDTFDVSTDSEVLRNFIKKASVVPVAPLPSPLKPKLPHPLKLLEDRRAWHPDKLRRNAEAIPKRGSRLVVARPPTATPHLSAKLPHRIGFDSPKAVSLCVRRHTRRNVLFALDLTRKGSGSRSRRRNQWSDVKC